MPRRERRAATTIPLVVFACGMLLFALILGGVRSYGFIAAVALVSIGAIGSLQSRRNPRRGHRDATRERRRLYIGAASVLVVANLYAPADPSLTSRFLASSLFLLALLPVRAWIDQRQRRVPFLPIVSAVYVLSYAMPVFLLREYRGWWQVEEAEADLVAAQILAIVGFGLLLGGYHLFGRTRIAGRLRALEPDFRLRLSESELILYGAIGLTVYVVQITSNVPVEVAQLVVLVSSLGLFATAGLFVLWHEGVLAVAGSVFLWLVLVPGHVLLGFAVGSNLQGAQSLILIAVLAIALRGTIPWSAVGVGLVILAILQPVKVAFREESRQLGQTATGITANLSRPLDNGARYVETFFTVTNQEGFSLQDAVNEFSERTADLLILSEVVELTPDPVPYWRGYTYAPLITKPIPRFVWAGKPLDETGQPFGHRYGFLHPENTTTSFNLPQPVELYVNFGLPGFLIGMVVIGALFRATIDLLTGPRLISLVIVAFVVADLVLIGSAFSLRFGAVPYKLAMLFLLGVVANQFRHGPARRLAASRRT